MSFIIFGAAAKLGSKSAVHHIHTRYDGVREVYLHP